MSWTLNGTPLDGSTGLSLAKIDLGVGMADSAEIASTNSWTEAAYTNGTAAELKQGDTVVLKGRFLNPTPYAHAGKSQGFMYKIVNPWHDIMTTGFKQIFYYATSSTARVQKWRSKVWLGTDPSGDRINTAQVIAAILAYAKDISGIGFNYDISGFGTMTPVTEATDQTCGSLIMQQLRWHPDVCLYWRYGTGLPLLVMKPLSALDAATLSPVATAPATSVKVEIAPRYDMVPPVVVVKYERVNDFTDGDGNKSKLIELYEDVAGGSISDQHKPGALVYTIELAGIRATGVTQPIRVRKVPAKSLRTDEYDDEKNVKMVQWYQCHLAAIKTCSTDDINVLEHLVIPDPSTTVDPADPTDAPPRPPTPGDPTNPLADFSSELVEGTVQEWMSGINVTPLIARVTMSWRGSSPPTGNAIDAFGSDGSQEFIAYVRYQGTNAKTSRYHGLGSWKAAEEWPTGLAAAVANGITSVRHEGSITIAGQTTPLSILPGQLLTVTGKGAGVVQRLSLEPQRGHAQIHIGWPQHLSPQDFFELLKASRGNEVTASYDKDRKGSAKATSGNTVEGALRGPRADVQMPSAGGCQFALKVVKGPTAGKISVLDGTISGMTPTLGGTAINHIPAPEVTLASGLSLYFKISVTPYGTNLGTTSHPRYRAAGGTVNTVEIVGSSSDPTDGAPASINITSGDATDGIYYQRLTTWRGAENCAQPLKGSQSVELCWNGDDESESLLRLNLSPT